MPKPQSGAISHKTALADLELITRMARRYRDDGIARVLGKLSRRTGKGKRWAQSRVGYVRRKYATDPTDEATHDAGILTLALATRHSDVSGATLIRLIKADILSAEQVAS